MRVLVHRLNRPDTVALGGHGSCHVGQVRAGGRGNWDWVVEGIERGHRHRHRAELLDGGVGKLQHETIHSGLRTYGHVPRAFNAVHGVGERMIACSSCKVIVGCFIGGVDVWRCGSSLGPEHVLREGVSVGVKSGDADADVVASGQDIFGLRSLHGNRNAVSNDEVDASNDGRSSIGQPGHAHGVVANKRCIPNQPSGAQSVADIGGRTGFVVNGPRESVG